MSSLLEIDEILKGGRGSGDWGHVGRAGKRGGSGGGGGKGRPRKGRRSRETLDKEIEARKKQDKITIVPSIVDKQTKSKRLKRHPAIKKLTGVMKNARYVGEPAIGVSEDLAVRSGVDKNTINKFIRLWDEGDLGPVTRAVHKEFGAKFSPYEKSIKVDSVSDPGIEDNKKIVRAMYEKTQEYLKDNGVTDIVLYRGVRYSKDSNEAKNIKAGNVMDYKGNSVESWTLTKAVAKSFGAKQTYPPSDSFVLATKFPASRIFSFITTGVGTDFEQEAVVFGNTSGEKVFIRDEVRQ